MCLCAPRAFVLLRGKTPDAQDNIPPRMHGGVSSLHGAARHVAVVTTAAIPWMTGTAVNPCLRAAYMAHCTSHQVTLIVQYLLACCAVVHGSHKGRTTTSVQLAVVRSCLSFLAHQFKFFIQTTIYRPAKVTAHSLIALHAHLVLCR